jgi:hypothetical protein
MDFLQRAMESTGDERSKFIKDMKGQSKKEMREAVLDSIFARDGGPRYMDKGSLLRGTCKELDKYVRCTFTDGPAAYTLQKFVYNASADNSTSPEEITATYRQNHKHIGRIFEVKAASAVATKINPDQQVDATGTYDGSLSATRSVNAQLRAGDIPIFSGLGVTDPRPETSRDGTYTFGFTPVKNGDTNAHLLTSAGLGESTHYGMFKTGDASTDIVEFALGGGKVQSASGLYQGWVWQPQVYIGSEFNPQVANTSAAGALAINLSGLTSGTYATPQFQLVVYALVGPRTDVGGYADSGHGEAYPLSCLREIINEQTVYIRTT